MAPKIVTLIRHGQAEHNVNERYHIRDPYLTPLGETQCLTLPDRFPPSPPVSLLVSSPLKRTIQTTLLGFPTQIHSGVPVLLLPQLQETSSLPCDTGSDVPILRADPMLKRTAHGSRAVLDFSACEAAASEWTSKKGFWGPDPAALTERARWVRKWLRERPEENVVCVLHGGFLHYLTEDWKGTGDFPGTGWSNTECRTYVWVGDTDSLQETEESKKHRTHGKPLGKTELNQFLSSHT